jgi:hypothetical protein
MEAQKIVELDLYEDVSARFPCFFFFSFFLLFFFSLFSPDPMDSSLKSILLTMQRTKRVNSSGMYIKAAFGLGSP